MKILRSSALAASIAVGLAHGALAETFVLVHGAFQTGKAWSAVAERLTKAGHQVIIVNLPGRDGDGKAIADAMVDEPLPPIATPVTLTLNHFGTVRRA